MAFYCKWEIFVNLAVDAGVMPVSTNCLLRSEGRYGRNVARKALCKDDFQLHMILDWIVFSLY